MYVLIKILQKKKHRIKRSLVANHKKQQKAILILEFSKLFTTLELPSRGSTISPC